MTTKSNQSISKKVLMFCGSVLVAGTAVLSFSDIASARGRDINAGPIWSHPDAIQKCRTVCRNVGLKWTGDWKTVKWNEQSVCGCGEWKLIGNSPSPIQQLTDSEQAKYDAFKNAIAHKGLSPKESAEEIGDSQFKRLQGNQYQVRISGGKRVTFTVDWGRKEVRILQAGGHT